MRAIIALEPDGSDRTRQGKAMQTERRLFLSMIAMTLAGAKAVLAGQRGRLPLPAPPGQIPDASGSGPITGNDDPLLRKHEKDQLKENQKNLRNDVAHLLRLAQELKDEADKTDQSDVLSLSLIRKAEEIEKLAHRIKGLAS